MKLSILTATYNRGKYLSRLYESIVNNKKTSGIEIEWIIIDDGSSDNTKEIVENFILENKFNIKYIYQENSGKMAAINRGMKDVTGELIVDCDSDDYFSLYAFKIIEENDLRLLNENEIYAMCFLKQDEFGNISGKKFEHDYIKSTMFDLYFRQEIEGEKILVFNASIRKKFKHELENNEKFVTEARMYHKMDKDYKVLCINEVVEIGEYIEDGYTKNILNTFKSSPNGYYKYFKEILQNGLRGATLKKKIYVIKHFLYFWILKHIRF